MLLEYSSRRLRSYGVKWAASSALLRAGGDLDQSDEAIKSGNPRFNFFIFRNILQAASSFSLLFCRMLSARLGWKLLNW